MGGSGVPELRTDIFYVFDAVDREEGKNGEKEGCEERRNKG